MLSPIHHELLPKSKVFYLSGKESARKLLAKEEGSQEVLPNHLKWSDLSRQKIVIFKVPSSPPRHDGGLGTRKEPEGRLKSPQTRRSFRPLQSLLTVHDRFPQVSHSLMIDALDAHYTAQNTRRCDESPWVRTHTGVDTPLPVLMSARAVQ